MTDRLKKILRAVQRFSLLFKLFLQLCNAHKLASGIILIITAGGGAIYIEREEIAEDVKAITVNVKNFLLEEITVDIQELRNSTKNIETSIEIFDNRVDGLEVLVVELRNLIRLAEPDHLAIFPLMFEKAGASEDGREFARGVRLTESHTERLGRW